MSILYPCNWNLTTFIFAVYNMYYILKTKQPKASGDQGPRPPASSPLSRISHIYSLTSTNIIVTKLARPDSGNTDKTETHVEPHF